VLTDWNGLTVAALAKAGSVLDEPTYLDVATKAADFILNQMRQGNVLYHRYAKGEAAVEGFLDDYAFFVFGLIELYEATFEDKYLQAATDLTKTMIEKFWDINNGGFYQSQNAEASLPKIKQLYDGATPSGNSVALYNLLRLSRLTNELAFETMATQMIKTFAQEVERSPEAYTFFLLAYDFWIGPSYSVTLVGEQAHKGTAEMVDALKKHYLPTTTVLFRNPEKSALDYQQIDGKATAYVCRDQMCFPATNHIITMLKQLDLTAQ
jgi:uncharacterized protein YyaL (SSP411 family)